MPDQSAALRRRHEAAVARLSGELAAPSPQQARLLLAHELAAYKGGRFTAGWRMPAEFSDRVRFFDLLVDEDYPFTAPRIALVDAPAPGTFPHVEKDGLLCLLSGASTVSSGAPIAVAGHQIVAAYRLIAESIADENRDDLLHEFSSYWNLALTPGAIEFVSLIEARPPSRLIRVWLGRDMNVLAEDEQTIHSWMRNRFGEEREREIEAAALVWLDRPLYPSEYPKTSNDLWRLAASRAGNDATTCLAELSKNAPDQAIVMLGAMSENGPCLAGVTVRTPAIKTCGGQTKNPLGDGFRPGRLPDELRAERFWRAATPVARSETERADAAWVHGRGQDVRQHKLARSSVVVIGCGSVGAPVARLLAMTGVGRLVLIDQDRLSWANTGRHPLGANYVDESKASSLADELRASHPHLTVEAHDERWQVAARRDSTILTSGDLIISATGDWGAECALDEWRREGEREIPVLYGWTEAHACAGHAVLLVDREACFACGFDEVGVPRLCVTSWAGGKGVLLQEPACGSVYQPYGAVELNHTVTLIGELALDALLGEADEARTAVALHRVWACRQSFLKSCGGEWTNEWTALPSHREEGGFTRSLPWNCKHHCGACLRNRR